MSEYFLSRDARNYPHLSLPYKYDNHGFYKHHYFMPDNMELEVLPTEKAFAGKQMLSLCKTISKVWISKKSFYQVNLIIHIDNVMQISRKR